MLPLTVVCGPLTDSELVGGILPAHSRVSMSWPSSRPVKAGHAQPGQAVSMLSLW